MTAKLFFAKGGRVAIIRQSRDRLRCKADLARMSSAFARMPDASLTPKPMVEVGRACYGLDVLFLNAGIAKFAPLADVPVAFFDKQFAINVKGVLFAAQKVAPLMASGSSIFCTTSASNRMGIAVALTYAATKAAIRSLVRLPAADLSLRGVRVNAISPGPIETPIFDKLGLLAEEIQAMVV